MLLFRCDAIEEREGQGAGSYGFGEGKVGCSRAGVRQPCRLEMDGREIAAGGDSALGESGLDAFAIGGVRESDNVDEPAYGAVVKSERGEFEGRGIG